MADKYVEEIYEAESGIMATALAEIRMARRCMPALKIENPESKGPECRITGYDYNDSGNPAIFIRRCNPKAGHGDLVPLDPGRHMEVRGVAIHEGPNGEKALEVETTGETYGNFVIDARDLTFSGRWSLVELYMGRNFEMQAVMRQGVPRLTRLPVIEQILHEYLKDRQGKSLPCRLLEKRGHNLYFVLADLEKKGIIEGAYMRQPRGSTYEIGHTYKLYLERDTGKARETIPAPPSALLDFVESNKKRHGIFWNQRQSRLHVTSPMTDALRQELKALDGESWFQTCIDRLYRHSNMVNLWEFKSNRYLDTGKKAEHNLLMHKDIPTYSPGAKVCGRIWKICRNHVLVVLERGGTGIIRRSHLRWRSGNMIDPREVISADQRIEATVIRQYTEKDANGRDKVNIDLSLLDPADFPEKYQVGNVVEGKVFRVESKRGFALVELEPGICGILHASEVSCDFVKDIADHVRQGQHLSCRIKHCSLDPLADQGRRPVSITLSLKTADCHQFELMIHPESRQHIIGQHGRRLSKIQEETHCTIKVLDDRNKVRIISNSDKDIQEAVRRIKGIQKTLLQKITDRGDRRQGSYKGRRSLSARSVCKGKVRIPPSRIGLLIGKGAATVNRLKKESKCRIWCEQDGYVEISGRNSNDVDKAIGLIETLIPETERLSEENG